MKSVKRNNGICTHCGLKKELSDDHIPPKNLFSKPLPNNLITVPSCDKCNSGSSKDDEYFRLILTFRDDTNTHPEVQKIWPKVWKSFTNPFYGGLRKALLINFQEIDLWTKSGIYLGKTGSFDQDVTRIGRVLTRIINGVVFHSLKKRLPNNYERKWWFLNHKEQFQTSEQKKWLIDLLNKLIVAKKNVIGNNTFIFKIIHSKDDQFSTIGLLLFFEKVIFLFITVPRTINDG